MEAASKLDGNHDAVRRVPCVSASCGGGQWLLHNSSGEGLVPGVKALLDGPVLLAAITGLHLGVEGYKLLLVLYGCEVDVSIVGDDVYAFAKFEVFLRTIKVLFHVSRLADEVALLEVDNEVGSAPGRRTRVNNPDGQHGDNSIRVQD